MKTLFAILWTSIALTANSAFAIELKVTVNNVKTERGGQIIVMVFGEDGFPKNHAQAVYSKTQDSLQPIMEFFFHVAMKELAVKVLHDEDKDGRVTKNWTRIYPKEGLGFSNGQRIGLTGPPEYRHSKLSKQHFEDGLEISIVYP